MKIKDNFLLRNVADCYVVVPVGDTAVDFNGMLNLNETGAFLWRLLCEETTVDALVRSLTEEYEVDAETAQRDVSAFIEKLKGVDILE